MKQTTKYTLDAERLLTIREAGQSPSTEATSCLPVRVAHKERTRKNTNQKLVIFNQDI
ncbi:hypothetical protein QUB80_24865 [Chlorogloeopsis sp. ULAP01]|nr:hypothetical protein [Chlorogloeopsis sp. ULAP01]